MKWPGETWTRPFLRVERTRWDGCPPHSPSWSTRFAPCFAAWRRAGTCRPSGSSRPSCDARIPEEYAKAVRLSLKEANRLDGTVRGVLSIARTRAPRRDPESLHEVIRSALEALSPQFEDEKIAVETQLSAREDTVLGDRELLKGAFLNLFLNSVEVMNQGGILRIATANVTDEGGVASGSESDGVARIPGEGILVRISDDGPGVPQDLRNRIFDPFFTTKEGGSGFGLPLAIRVMEEHSGTLTLAEPQSSEAGATLLVVLPVFGPEREAP